VQDSFDFAADDLAFIRQALTALFGQLVGPERSDPVWRLVRALIGCRTYDTVADPAMARLTRRWPHPRDLAAADSAEIERVLGDVTFADDKARHLVATLGWIGRERPDYDLSFLKDRPVHQALAWLERFPGVGQKVAAATLNASTLRMRVFIVDSHVHRILQRFGFIGSRADAREGRDQVTAAAGAFDADGLLRLFAQMKRLGQTLCRFERPACHACPLAPRCVTARRAAA
jgi:endonuclease III